MIVRPDLWSDTIRIRFSNVFGTEPLTIGSADVALQKYAASEIAGTNVAITFGGKPGITIPAGERLFSDPIKLGFVNAASKSLLDGRNLAISFAITGRASALSHHGSAYTTSYISGPGSGDHAAEGSGSAFPYTTTSWFIIDAVDAMAADDTAVIAVVGDSISDGTLGTNNVNDRWPDVLAGRLHDAFGDKVSVVNAAINANALSVAMTGPAAVDRLERDVLGLSGVRTVVLLEGINDLGAMGVSADALIEGYRTAVAKAPRRRFAGGRRNADAVTFPRSRLRALDAGRAIWRGLWRQADRSVAPAGQCLHSDWGPLRCGDRFRGGRCSTRRPAR